MNFFTKLIIVCSLSLGFFSCLHESLVETSQNEIYKKSLDEILQEINLLLSNNEYPTIFKLHDEGNITRELSEPEKVIYEFNLKNVEVIQYERQFNFHMIKFICTDAKRCFYCDVNEGAGVVHYLEVSNEADARKAVENFKYLKEELSK